MWKIELSEDTGTKYEQIASAIEQDIASGQLKPGDRLPPQRKLAKQLSVTIGTIGRAYALAERRGLTRSEVGRGCFVVPAPRSQATESDRDLVIDLGMNLPPDLHSNQLFENTLHEFARRRNLDELFGALPVDAFPHQREAAAKWLGRRIDCTADDVLICTGTQNALISSLSTLTRPGDSILVESLTFPGILKAVKLLNLVPIPVPMDADGILPDEIESRCGLAKALYLNPTNHNPTTSTLSMTRRKAIARIANKRGLWVIEDDTYGHLMPESPPTVSSLAPERSILISSLSKTMMVGLRLALLRAPQTIRSQVVSQFNATSFFPSSISVEIASKWIEDGTADTMLDLRLQAASRRQEIAADVLNSEFISGRPELNHVWLNLPESWTATSLCRAASENGVIVLPASVFTPGRTSELNSIRIALGAARTDAELRVGLEKISRLLDGDTSLPMTRF